MILTDILKGGLIAGAISLGSLTGCAPSANIPVREEPITEVYTQEGLESHEYVFSSDVMDARDAIFVRKGSYSAGFYVCGGLESSNDSFIVEYLKTNLYEKLQNLGFTQLEADSLYDIINTKGNIILREGFDDEILGHERMHKSINEYLIPCEIKILKDSRDSFVSWMDSTMGNVTLLHLTQDGKLDKTETKSISFSKKYISDEIMFEIHNAHWDELYAYMAGKRMIGVPSSWNSKISYNFKQQNPLPYEIYEALLNGEMDARQMPSDSESIIDLNEFEEIINTEE